LGSFNKESCSLAQNLHNHTFFKNFELEKVHFGSNQVCTKFKRFSNILNQPQAHLSVPPFDCRAPPAAARPYRTRVIAGYWTTLPFHRRNRTPPFFPCEHLKLSPSTFHSVKPHACFFPLSYYHITELDGDRRLHRPSTATNSSNESVCPPQYFPSASSSPRLIELSQFRIFPAVGE
jgi:hypothetical protein